MMSVDETAHTRKILIVDDDADSRQILKRFLLAAGYQVETAEDGQQAIEKMKSNVIDLVLLDINMPGISGYETLLFLRSREDYVAVIFISANTKIEDIIRGLDAGADDYIRKPFDIREVLSRVRAKLRVKDVQDQLTAANQKLAGLVDIDDLTGLFNMRSIYDRIEREIVRCLRFSRPMALIMMDMDHFKKVNDNHDHLFGSFVISEIGKIIRANIRKVDFGARYGGDEFLVALTETTKDGAMLFCERLRSTIENYDFTSGPDHERLTSSIGVAILDPQAPTDSRTLVRKADEMLYASKENGRNRVTLYDFSIERGHASGIDQTKLRRATET
jgi:diguanylate cyclase (GGDEF)-like protein